MEKLVDDLLKNLTDLKPRVADFASLDSRLAASRSELANLNAQLDRLRSTLDSERNTRAAERHSWEKEHADMTFKRQGAYRDMEDEIRIGRQELTQIQNDIAKYQRKLDELAAQYNKEVRALA